MNSFHRQRASHRRWRRLVPVGGGQSSPSRSRRFTSLVAACGSSGKATVPRVVGLPIDRAVNTVSQEGFPVSVSRHTRRRSGDAISRSHRLRARALHRTRPWRWLSRPVSLRRGLRISGQKVDAATSSIRSRYDAQAQLDQVGLSYTVYVVPSDEKVGYVVAQDPPGVPRSTRGERALQHLGRPPAPPAQTGRSCQQRQSSIRPGGSVRRRRSGSRHTVIRRQRRDSFTVRGRALRHGLLVDRLVAA
jgi:hypothetical protein